jgi:hypothetical protein
MRPTQPTSAAERKVIVWLFTTLGIAAAAYIGYGYWTKASACDEACAVEGRGEGTLRMTGGSRLTLGSACECAGDRGVRPAE